MSEKIILEFCNATVSFVLMRIKIFPACQVMIIFFYTRHEIVFTDMSFIVFFAHLYVFFHLFNSFHFSGQSSV